MSERGHIIGGPVDSDYDGATLTADLAVGDTVLHVDDPADFDEDAARRGAELLIDPDLDDEGVPDPATGSVLAYATYDDAAGTVILSAASTVTALSGDSVFILDPVSGRPTGRLNVEVATDDGDTSGDALAAYLDVALLESVGDVDLTDLAVDLDEDEDGQLYVAGFPGLTQRQGRVRGFQDSHVAVSSSDLTFNLTYQPLPGSTVHLYWNGVLQEDDAWSLDGWTITVDDPDGFVTAGDRFYVKYLYTDPTTAPVPPPPPDPLASLNILGRWDLDDTSGTTAHATLGSDGTYVNSPSLGQSPLVADGGKAVATDWNSSQDITLPITGSYPGATAPGWILFDFKYGGSSNPFSTIVFRDHTSAVSQGFFLSLGGTNPLIAQGGGSALNARTISSITSASLLDGAHHQLLLGFELDGRALWIDGDLADTWTASPGGAPYFWDKIASPLHFGKDGTLSQYTSFTYDRVMVGSDPLATLSGLALDIWHAAGGS